VDPYVVYDEYTEWVDSPVWSLENINEIYQDAVSRLKMYTSQIEFVRLYSSVASNVIPNNLDFVYIDGNHNYEYVKQDMECWYPKIKPGGVICGHDLQYPGVTKAFVELAYGKQEVFCGHRSFDCNGVSHCLQPDWWIVKE